MLYLRPSTTICSIYANSFSTSYIENKREFKQKLSPQSREQRVPATRFGRLINFGGMIAGIGLGTVSEVIKRNIEGSNDPNNIRSAILSPQNMERLVKSLCKVRGASLKLAQFLSIQDSSIVDPHLRMIFERVRDSADYMPPSQLKKVLDMELGGKWRDMFVKFESKPFAAASIGQVHRGVLVDGREVAVKVQYMGVDSSIDSDIKNLMAIVNMSNVFPNGLYIERSVEVARKELLEEVDYIREANCMRHYKELLGDDPFLSVPAVVDELSTKRILTSELIYGQPVNTISQPVINEVCSNILRLVLTELYHWRFMQSDPNWSNFYYDSSHKLHLLDFGATRTYSKSFVDNYLRLINSAIDNDRDRVLTLSRKIGFLTGDESSNMEDVHCTSIMTLAEALKSQQFDFGAQDVTTRITALLPTMMKLRLTPPPDEIYSLHRKMAGIFMLFCELKAVVPCSSIFETVKAGYVFDN